MKMLKLLMLGVLIGLCFACSKSEDESDGGVTLKPTLKTKVEGKIEKGPFLTGSKVTLYELGADLKQTGKNIFKTETVDDNGSFMFDSRMELSSQYVELEINGYFYNEVRGRRSEAQITLNAIADISNKDKVNANILTHLEYKRVKILVSKGLSFESAKKQAKQELLKNFCILTETEVPDNISFTDNNESASVLLAVSAILLDDRGEAEFSEFIAKLGNDFAENGTITNKALLDEIHRSQKNVNASTVTKNLKSYYEGQGKTVEFSNISKYIDNNGDGVLDKKDEIPEENLSEETFFQKEDDFKGALTSCYQQVSDYLQRTTVLDAIRCKQINEDDNIGASDQTVHDAWGKAYRALRMVNLIIEKGVKVSKFDAKPYVATAKTLRAMVYLDMVQHWGDVPFITKVIYDPSDPDVYMPRTNKENIYNSLLNDLEASIPALLEKVDLKHSVLSQDLAYVLMATIQLEKKEGSIDKAENYLKGIVESGSYEMSGNRNIYSSVDNREALFSLLFLGDEQAGSNTAFYMFDKNLKRGICHPVYRISGVTLMYAEALLKKNETAKMKEVINKVRSAHGLPLLNEISNPKKEICELWNQIINTDYGYFALLKRMNLAVDLLGIKEYQQLFPIPQQEVLLNPKITQNPGYRE